MAGVKQFDVDAVLDKVMSAFWARGYESTSIDDLVEATGLKRGSLYNAFGDKEQMFLAAMRRYLQRQQEGVREALEDPDPRRALSRFLDWQLSQLRAQSQPLGCMLTNACAELGVRVDAVGCELKGAWVGTENAFYDVLLRAQARGMLAPGRDLRALARFFLGTSHAMSLLYRTTGDLSHARDMARCALAVLDAPGPGAEEPRGAPSGRQ